MQRRKCIAKIAWELLFEIEFILLLLTQQEKAQNGVILSSIGLNMHSNQYFDWSTIESFAPWMRRFFDPKQDDYLILSPSVKNILSNDDCTFSFENGYAISSNSFANSGYNGIDDDIESIFNNHRKFAQFVLFDRDGIKNHNNGNDIVLNDAMFEKLLLKPQQVSKRFDGRGK